MYDFRYTPRDLCMNSETYHYKRGANQQFSQVSHTFDPSQYLEEELTYNPDRDVIPVAIHCVAEEGGEGNKYGKKSVKIQLVIFCPTIFYIKYEMYLFLRGIAL